MATQSALDTCYMAVAEAHAELSKAKRRKVGAAIVTSNGCILAGTNGMAPKSSNELEYLDEDTGELVTKAEVIHAELSCILRAAKQGVSVVGGTLYTTLSCCSTCAEMIMAAGIVRVVYKDEYRCLTGIERLRNMGIIVEKLTGE